MHITEYPVLLPSRRTFLQNGLGGAFVLAFNFPAHAVNEPEQSSDSTEGKFAPNAFIRIDHAGKTTLVMPQVEMDRGIYTAVAMILAEELDAEFGQVTLEHAPPDGKLYGNPRFGIQVTGSSNSVRAFWKPLRVAGGGVARDAGSGRGSAVAGRSGDLFGGWRQGDARCHRPRCGLRRSHRCGECASRAERSATQGPEGFHANRQTAQAPGYAQEDRRQGRLRYWRDAAWDEFAILAQSPVFGGKIAHVDDSAAKDIPGIRRIAWCSRISSRSSAIISGPPRPGSMRWRSLGTKAPRQPQFDRYLGRATCGQPEEGRHRQVRRRRQDGPEPERESRCRTTFRSSPMQPWSRRSALSRSRLARAKYGPAPGDDGRAIRRGGGGWLCRSTR
jgi:hypothetical protein